LPAWPGCRAWTQLLNTELPAEEERDLPPGARLNAPPRSVRVFAGSV